MLNENLLDAMRQSSPQLLFPSFRKYDMPAKPHVSIIVCGAPMVCATAMLNPNSVPNDAEAEFQAAASRMAIFLDHVKALPSDLERCQTDFHMHLQRNWGSYVAAVTTRAEIEYIAYTDGLGYVARLHAILYEFKAFLDLFTRLLCRLISSPSPPHGFNKGKIRGADVSGGRLINWLQGHTIDRLPTRDAMVLALSSATTEWITQAVDIRDTLGHRRDLPGFRHMRIPVSGGPTIVKQADILQPEMPDGRDLESFVTNLRDSLCNLVSDILPLTPRVNPELNEPWHKAKAYLVK